MNISVKLVIKMSETFCRLNDHSLILDCILRKPLILITWDGIQHCGLLLLSGTDTGTEHSWLGAIWKRIGCQRIYSSACVQGASWCTLTFWGLLVYV